MKCYYCGKSIHLINDCFKKTNSLGSGSNHDNGTFAIATFDKEESVDIRVAYVSSIERSDKDWVLNSSCFFHISLNISWFSDFSNLSDGFCKTREQWFLPSKGIGNIVLKLKNTQLLRLNHTRYVPFLRRNLISLGALDDEEYHIEIKNDFANIIKNLLKINGIYSVNSQSVFPSTTITLVIESDKSKLWHKRFGHLSEKGLKFLSKERVVGKYNIQKLTFCEHCVMGKQNRLFLRTWIHNSQNILEYIQSYTYSIWI